MMFKPSLIASGCILAAYNGLLASNNSRPSSNQLSELTTLTQQGTSDINNAFLLVEKIIQRETSSMMSSQSTSSSSNKIQHSSKHNTSNSTSSHTKDKPDTPIDVQDVRFWQNQDAVWENPLLVFYNKVFYIVQCIVHRTLVCGTYCVASNLTVVYQKVPKQPKYGAPGTFLIYLMWECILCFICCFYEIDAFYYFSKHYIVLFTFENRYEVVFLWVWYCFMDIRIILCNFNLITKSTFS